jgi:hypothetical protein
MPFPAGSYPAQVVADGAVAYWRLGETSGLTAVDVIGGNNGTISGGVTLGQLGALADGDKAMTFNGTTGKITVPHASAITPTGAFTVELWMRTAATAEQPMVTKFGPEGPPAGFSINKSSAGRVYVWLGNGFISGTTTVLHNGNWHHTVVVWTGALLNFYVDGIEDQSLSTTAVLGGTHTLDIGYRYDNSSYWTDAIDEVAYYPTALTAPQIAAHYAARTFVGASLPTVPWAVVGGMAWKDDMDSYTEWLPLTPSDTADLVRFTDAILVGGAGDVAAVMQNNRAVTLTGLPAGAWVPIKARRINATGTTATSLVALYQD